MGDKIASFAELVADSEPATEVVDVGDHSVTIRELTGRERFSLAAKSEDNQWDVMLWVCMCGLIDPEPSDESDLEKLKPEWISEIAKSIFKLSGVTQDEEEEAGKESASVSAIGGS